MPICASKKIMLAKAMTKIHEVAHAHLSPLRKGNQSTRQAYRLKAVQPMKRVGSLRANIRTRWLRVMRADTASKRTQPALTRLPRTSAPEEVTINTLLHYMPR